MTRHLYNATGCEGQDVTRPYRYRLRYLEAVARELLAEVIAVRDQTFDCCTNSAGEYGDDGDSDRREVERLDAMIDRAQALLLPKETET